MRTPREIATSYSHLPLEELIRRAVREAVDICIRKCQTVKPFSAGLMLTENEIRDHFKKAGY